ncbi:MAG TPA: transposase [Candidatus Butyricicoccus avistercoris]|uniref:Transposase n=1 Tax=Candidatus Butyricicoccus avistercoris TaxID=2838518 RepID=A0A9D1PGB8_9FIRM|nr:transposase [Candidatus Butyricicoccus avistercoris]
MYESGKTYADIKKEYGISSSTLSVWVKKYSQVKIDDNTILTAQQIKALQKRNAELEEENVVLKKSDCNIHATLSQRLKAIEILSKQHKISILCRVLNVNRSTYYKYINHKPSNR